MAEPAGGAGNAGDVRDAGDAEVEDRLVLLDGLLERVEQLPGPSGELARDALGALAQLYGTALARAAALAGAEPAVASSLGADPLLGHLFVLHGIACAGVDLDIAAAFEAGPGTGGAGGAGREAGLGAGRDTGRDTGGASGGALGGPPAVFIPLSALRHRDKVLPGAAR